MTKVFDEKELKAAIIRAMYEKQDGGYYDYDEEYHPDDEYYGWQDAINFLLNELKLEITDADWEYYWSNHDY